jgi:hypothetical protein
MNKICVTNKLWVMLTNGALVKELKEKSFALKITLYLLLKS